MLVPVSNKQEYDFIKPELRTDSSKQFYVPFGRKNDFPEQSAKLSREVAVHRSILNRKRDYCIGSYINGSTTKLMTLIDGVNEAETLKQVLKKVTFDYLSTGNGFIEGIAGRNWVKLYHIDSTTCRRKGDMVFQAPDWSKVRKEDQCVSYPVYPNIGTDGRFVIHIKDYEPQFHTYGLPQWYAGMRAAVINGLTSEHNKSNLENGFNISGMLFIPGVNDTESAKAIKKKVSEFYEGSEDTGGILEFFLKDLEVGQQREKPELIDLRRKIEGSYMDLYERSDDELIMVHGWYRTLTGMHDSTGFDTERIINEWKIALSQVVKPYQNDILDYLYPVLGRFGYNGEIEFVNENPLMPQYVELYEWEWREANQLPFNPSDKNQQKRIKINPETWR